MKRFSIFALLMMLVIALAVSCDNGDDDDDDNDDNDTGDDDDDDNDDDDDFEDVPYAVVDTMQRDCFDLAGNVITCGSEYSGQDAEYTTITADYTTMDDVVMDNNTGFMWEYAQSARQYSFSSADDYCADRETGGYTDWRLPTIKELYSLADFNGQLVDGNAEGSTPYIDEDYFDFEYADRMAFATQFWSSTTYEVNKVGGAPDDAEAYSAAFGFNFADGHIKAYGTADNQPGLYIRCVRGEENIYGVNDFSLEEEGTIVSDASTGLMWEQSDGGVTRAWYEALEYCEALELGGYDDWRLPDNKELQSIVEYGKAEVPAIDTDFFECTFNESYGGADFDGDYGWYWTSTTLGDFPKNACYLTFGRAYSTTDDLDAETVNYHDWHGAGAQRSDPKDGVISTEGACSITACDLERGVNYARCVRGNPSGPVTGDDDDDDAGDDDIGDDDTGDDDDDDDDMEAPPQEAVDACNGMNPGDDCEFEGMGGETVTGTCEEIGDVLACVPESGPLE